MAQGNQTVLKIRAEIEGLQGLNQLKTAVRRISAEAKGANNDFGKLSARIKELQSATVGSINNLKAQRQAFDALRNSVDVTSKEFKQATQEIEALDKKLAKLEGRKVGGGRLRAGAQIAGTVAGAGVFGGPEGAIGALAGGVFGGVGGAVIGGAIGAQVGGIRQALGGVAEYSADLNKLRIALQGVTASQSEYNEALSAVSRASQQFAIPQSLLTEQFTKLQASVSGAGGTVADTETAFKGIVAAVRATGGSLADVDAALTATSQVFSKGKVSAEELRGQIGERLPGAFTLFAEAIGKTPMELDKALQDGKVSLDDFQSFAEQLFKKYGKTAEIIASGPEGAGDRLQLALEKLKEAIGPILADIGAQFQDLATKGVNALTRIINKTIEVLNLGQEGRLKTAQAMRKAASSEVERISSVIASGTLSEGEKETQKNMLNLAYRRRDLAEADIREIQIKMQGASRRGRGIPEDRKRRFDLDERGDRGRPKGGKTDPMAELRKRTAEEFRALDRSFAEVARLRLSKETAEIELQIIDAQKRGNEQLALQLRQKLEMRRIDLNIEGLTEQIRKHANKIAEAKKKGVDVTRNEEDLVKQQNSLLILQTEKQKLLAEQAKDRFLFEQKIKEEVEAQQKSFEEQFTDRQRQLGLISEGDYNQILLGREEARLGREFPGISEEQRAQMLDLYRQEIDPTSFESMRQNITQLREELATLVDPVNQITNAANAIGDAFATSFVDAISGAKTAQEALSEFFKSVGSYFLDMAKQIIAKMIQIAILNAVTGLLPGFSGGGGFNLGSTPLGAGGGSVGGIGTLGPNFGIAQRANGGPVTGGSPYIVGERGPELFIPFQSGRVASNDETEEMLAPAFQRNGSSNVSNSYQGGSSNVSNSFQQLQSVNLPFTRTSERIETERQERETLAAIRDPGPIDVRYESQVINGVEYVTAEQHRKGMAQAAERGRALTLQALQGSVKTRKKVGL